MVTMVLLMCSYAPAPFEKRVKSIDMKEKIVGTWSLEWSGHKAEQTFYKNGAYKCKWFSLTYNGWWTVNHKGNVVVHENLDTTDGEMWRIFEFVLDKVTMCGKAVGINVSYETSIKLYDKR